MTDRHSLCVCVWLCACLSIVSLVFVFVFHFAFLFVFAIVFERMDVNPWCCITSSLFLTLQLCLFLSLTLCLYLSLTLCLSLTFCLSVKIKYLLRILGLFLNDGLWVKAIVETALWCILTFNGLCAYLWLCACLWLFAFLCLINQPPRNGCQRLVLHQGVAPTPAVVKPINRRDPINSTNSINFPCPPTRIIRIQKPNILIFMRGVS